MTGQKPFTYYKFVITAYNSGGNGPESVEVAAATDEAGKIFLAVLETTLRIIVIMITTHRFLDLCHTANK